MGGSESTRFRDNKFTHLYDVFQKSEYTCVNGISKSVIPNSSLIISFVANIILVLEGGRLAYKSDDVINNDINDYMVQTVIKLYPELTYIPYPSETPLIILKRNHTVVMNILSVETEIYDFDIASRYVLGYAHPNSDWNDNTNNYMYRYNVHWKGFHTTLYSFTIPVDLYSQKIELHMTTLCHMYDSILGKYGCECDTDVFWKTDLTCND